MDTKPLLSIIIPTKDRQDIFDISCLFLIKAIQDFDIEVIVINDSKVNEVTLPEKLTKVRIIKNNQSGVASARNLGASLAKGKWLLFLDDDMLINEENIHSYLRYTNREGKFCVNIEWAYPPDLINQIKQNAFGRFLIKYGFTTMRGWSGNPLWPQNSSITVKSITSQNLFLTTQLFIETGGYNENFPYAGFEDYAFSKHLEKNGFEMYVDTTSLMYHNEIDRTEPKAWFKRKERGGETRRIATTQGYREVEIKQSLIKKTFYLCTHIIEPLIGVILFFSDRFKITDMVSFTCYKALLGISINKGYNKK